MTLRDAASDAFQDPARVSDSDVRGYFQSLRDQLRELGFAITEENTPATATGNLGFSPIGAAGLPYIQLLGNTEVCGPAKYAGTTLTIYPQRNGEQVSIQLAENTGVVHPGQYHLAFEVGADKPFKRPFFLWEERDQMEYAIVEWILNNASADIAKKLNPGHEPPKADLRAHVPV